VRMATTEPWIMQLTYETTFGAKCVVGATNGSAASFVVPQSIVFIAWFDQLSCASCGRSGITGRPVQQQKIETFSGSGIF